MTLPELVLQTLYARLGWGVVLAAGAVALWSCARPLPRGALIALVVVSLGAMALPGSMSPAFWLGLALQRPSALLVGCCALTLWSRWARVPTQAMPLGAAACLAAAGTVLYADSAAWLSLDLYAKGFGPTWAPVAGVLMGAAATVCIVRGSQHAAAWAWLVAVMIFATLRLPTGNLWDALLDPLLWCWAWLSMATHLVRRYTAAPSPVTP